MKSSITLATLSLLSLTAAHFELEYPTVRGFDEDKLAQFPCGGQNSVSTKRTPWPITNGSIALKLGHSLTNIEVLLAVGNSPGGAFNTILRPTFAVNALGDFCMTGFKIPESLKVKAGMNATIQVQTNGDPKGGLYNCADVTFVETAAEVKVQKCSNTTFTLEAATVSGHPNGTALGGSGSATEGGAAQDGAAASPTPSAPGAGSILNAGIGGVVLAAAAAAAIAFVL